MGHEIDNEIAAVPEQFADEISLCGPRERIRTAYRRENSPVTSLLVNGNADFAKLIGGRLEFAW